MAPPPTVPTTRVPSVLNFGLAPGRLEVSPGLMTERPRVSDLRPCL
jgi:hypothetical protein